MNRFNSAVLLLTTLVTMAACASTDPPVGPTTVPTPAPAPAPTPTEFLAEDPDREPCDGLDSFPHWTAERCRFQWRS
jgi:hypothetical protein